MNLQEIEQNVANLDPTRGFEFIYDLLRAFGVPKASISRLRSGSHDRSERDDEVLWKGRLYYRYLAGEDDPYVVIDDAGKDPIITKERPRFLIVHNRARLLAVDSRMETTLDIAPHELSANAAFFLPWAGIEKTQLEMTSYADIKAAEKMARLYDEIIKHNELSTAEQVHDLNVFFSRLLFCFFAEDTGVFEKGSFTNALASLTATSGEDTASFLDALFEVLDLPEGERKGVPAHFLEFGYVNGKLFARHASAPKFSAKARKLILECGTLNWSQINPDIFGSMMQAVVHYGDRQSLGMHYTSVENIMKVIRPLFLDDLHDALEKALDSVSGLERLLSRISNIRIFDPACGSGNFLVIAYKELRRLEHGIIQRLQELAPTKSRMFVSNIELHNFYGIEIDDFAVEVAILSLWLAKHQMNVEFKELFGVEIPLIPLSDSGNIVCGNAAALDWSEVCPTSSDQETYLLSNPPYLGARLQSPEQKSDLQGLEAFDRVSNNLDYVAIWFLKGAQYVSESGGALGFVATNSICQGSQVEMLWPQVFKQGVDISFGVQSFRWSNSAKGKAAVTCVIVGLQREGAIRDRVIFSDGFRRSVSRISPYLTEGRRLVIRSCSNPISDLPPMTFGSMANDGGHLILTRAERDDLLEDSPEAGRFVKSFLGAHEFIQGVDRFVLWIDDEGVEEALAIPEIARRIRSVKAYRMRSRRAATRRLAEVPHRFGEVRHQDTNSIIVPRHSSENRSYVPMGFLDERTVISDAANAVYSAALWVFGLLQSRIHMAWVRSVAGRIKSDIRYSTELCYNAFPVPQLRPTQTTEIEAAALRILDVRESFSDRSLAELYRDEVMPKVLLHAHEALDAVVDSCYGDGTFESDEARLESLFDMYERVAGVGEVHA